MIVTRIIGGLGNQMFQYAAARALSQRINVPLKLDLTGFEAYKLHAYGLNNFNIVESLAELSNYVIGEPVSMLGKINKLIGLRTRLQIYRENGLAFNAQILELSSHTYLDGYWQSENYFLTAEKQIRNDFSFKVVPDAVNQECLDHIKSVMAISVHIRRGDYVSNPVVNSVHGVCDLDYYQRAVKFLRSYLHSEDLHFFVFSDDPAWVKQHMDFGPASTFVSHNNTSKNYEDLRLMSACRHHVIANSSFSWWGAWLNPRQDKVVIAPKKWFQSEDLDSSTIVPANWIRL